MTVDNVFGVRDVLTPTSYLGKGMAWPPRKDPATGDFAKADGEVSISDCLLHLITTVIGEISPMMTYGTRVDELLFSEGDDSLVQEVALSIRDAIRVHEQRVTVIDMPYEIRNVTKSSRLVELSIRYRIVATGQIETRLVTFPPGGGTV